MYKKFYLLTPFLFLLLHCSPKAGPKIISYKKKGDQYKKMIVYCYPGGEKKIMEINIWKNGWLFEEKIFYVRWPNDELKHVSKEGFYTYKNGKYLLNNDSVCAPDGIIYRYYDSHFKEVIQVYENCKKVPYTKGYYDGYRVTLFQVDTPGVYVWKAGKLRFERPLTEEERRSSEYHLK